VIKIRIGYGADLRFPATYSHDQVLSTHFSRVSDIVVPDYLPTSPPVTISPYRDAFGN
jgi:hypothetical protein